MTNDDEQTQDEQTLLRDEAVPRGETATHDGNSSRDEAAPSEAVSPREDTAPREDAAARPAHAPAQPTAELGDVLRLQPRLVPRADGLYYVSEILAYHDEAFVEAAFASVLRRAPADDEFRPTLADLRNGAREKIDILRDLARTPEGKRLAASERIAGLKQSRLTRYLRGLPVVGHLWQLLAAILRLPVALRHQRQFEAYALAQQQRIADHINAQRWERTEALERAAAELRLAVADASAAVSLLSDALAETSARHAEQQSQLARHVGEVTRQLERAEHGLREAERRLNEHAAGSEEHGRRLEEHGRRIDAQQEFLVREQQAVVEAQKAALASAEEDLRETTTEQQRELAALSARVDELRVAVEAARESVGGKV